MYIAVFKDRIKFYMAINIILQFGIVPISLNNAF